LEKFSWNLWLSLLVENARFDYDLYLSVVDHGHCRMLNLYFKLYPTCQVLYCAQKILAAYPTPTIKVDRHQIRM
jgi:hypothetical protein